MADMIESSTQTSNKSIRSPSKRKVQETTSPYETRSKKKIKVNISEMCSESNLLIDEKTSTPQKRSHQDSECSVVSTTDEDEQDEDSNVDSLIQQLSDLIRSCGKEEHIGKDSTLQKASKQSISNSAGSDSCTKTYPSKRKSQVPKKTRKNLDLETVTDDKISEMPNNQTVDSAENCSDGEANLIIANPKKSRRKASSSDSTHIPDEVMDFIVKSSIDDKLQSIAQREKLTEMHVKNIIKQVVTDKSVLAMLRNSIYGIDFGDPNGIPVYEPKLTRAKTKELYEQQMKVVAGDDPLLWGGSSCPIEMEPTATHALVTQEFPEEEDDDEYQPELDEQVLSDEESMLSGFRSPSTTASQSRHQLHTLTPSSTCSLTPKNASTPIGCVKTLKTTETEFRTVQRTLNFSKEEPSLICSRTRSKYPMTDTPLEYLEMAFKPPDITADMYETEIDDEEWKKFLLDFSQPQDTTKTNDDDEQVDPEYNLMADAEEEDPSFEELREELRGDRAVRISKKEVNALMMEFLDSFNVMDDDDENNKSRSRTSICQQLMESGTCADDLSGGQKIFDLNNTIMLPDDTQIISQPHPENYYLVNLDPQPPVNADLTQEEVPPIPEPITVTFILPDFSKEQLEVLRCQMSQHVQLLTQTVLQTCYSKILQFIESGAKQMLREIDTAGNLSCHQGFSLFHQFNLKFALDTVAQYDAKKADFDNHVLKEGLPGRYGYDQETRPTKCSWILYKFPRIIQELFIESSAFPYLHLLPAGLFYEYQCRNRRGFLDSEYILLAVAFSEVVSDLSMFKINPYRLNSPFPLALTRACVAVAKQKRVHTKATTLNTHIRTLLLRHSLDGEHEYNPLVHFATTGMVDLPRARVHGLSKSVPCALKNVDLKFLPISFKRIVRRYWKARNRKEKAPPIQPITPQNTRAAAQSNIIIIQNGSQTQIILPNSYTIVPQTLYLKEPEPHRPLPQQPQAYEFNPPSSTPPSSGPSFNVYRKPVNTVAPTPISMTLSSSQPSLSASGAPVRNDASQEKNLPVPHLVSTQPSLMSPPALVLESTATEPILPKLVQLPIPQRKGGIPPASPIAQREGRKPPVSPIPKREGGTPPVSPIPQREGGTPPVSVEGNPESKGVNEEVVSSPGPSPSPPHHPSSSEIPSRVSSTSKLSPFFGMTDTPDTPLLDMPYLLDTPCIGHESPRSKNPSPRSKGAPLGPPGIYSPPSFIQPSPWASPDTEPGCSSSPNLGSRFPRTPPESKNFSCPWNLSLKSKSFSSSETRSPAPIDQQDGPEPETDSKDQIKNVVLLSVEEDLTLKPSVTENLQQVKGSSCSTQESTRMGRPTRRHERKSTHILQPKKCSSPKKKNVFKEVKAKGIKQKKEATHGSHSSNQDPVNDESGHGTSKRVTTCIQVDAMAVTEASESKKIGEFVNTNEKKNLLLTRGTKVGNKQKKVGIKVTKKKNWCTESEEEYNISEEIQEAGRKSIAKVNNEEINGTHIRRLQLKSERENLETIHHDKYEPVNSSENDEDKWVEETENVSANKIDEEEDEEGEELIETLELNFFRRVKENLAKEGPNKFMEFISILKTLKSHRDSPQVVYFEVLKILEPFPDLHLQFLVLLNPDQAKAIGKYPEYCVIQFIKKVFEESVGASHDPVYQSKLIHELGSLLRKEGIHKEQLVYFLKPIISLEPNLVDFHGESPQDFEELMDDPDENSQTKSERSSPEMAKWASREISVSPFRESLEVSSSSQSSPAKERLPTNDDRTNAEKSPSESFPKASSSSAIFDESLHSWKNETCRNDPECMAFHVNCEDAICPKIEHSYESSSLSQNEDEKQDLETSDSFNSMKIEPDSISGVRTSENITQFGERNIKGKNKHVSSKSSLNTVKSGKTNPTEGIKRKKRGKQLDHVKVKQKKAIKTRSSPRKKDKFKCQASSAEIPTWTKKEDEFLINCVRTNRKLTPSFYRMAAKSIPNKVKEQIRERLIFILDILSPSC